MLLLLFGFGFGFGAAMGSGIGGFAGVFCLGLCFVKTVTVMSPDNRNTRKTKSCRE